MKIILTTLNARYTHTSFGLRYIYASLREFQKDATIIEFSINDAIQSIASSIMLHMPKILGISVYIWNAKEVHELIHIIKKVSPKTIIVLGGPEVSYAPMRVDFSSADYIIQGEGEESFYNLCKEIASNTAPTEPIIPHKLPNLSTLPLPYAYYTDEDIKNRFIYVESSRGCPFLCEFCLSSIDEKVRSFPIDALLEAFEQLWQRGARNFKFVDRTFNINMRVAHKILDFFLSKEPPYFAHFEVIPDHFPETLKEKLKLFAKGTLQLEIGIQTLSKEVSARISRPLDLEKITQNITFLEHQTGAHLHLDLIVGLPGESLESFGANLDLLTQLSSSEIQIGILKKLSGTHIERHDAPFAMIYSDIPPYDILQNSLLGFEDIMIMKRFARFWEIYYNSFAFQKTLPLLYESASLFQSFYAFGMWIYSKTEATHKISFDRAASLLYEYLTLEKKLPYTVVAPKLLADVTCQKGRAIPHYLKEHIQANRV